MELHKAPNQEHGYVSDVMRMTLTRVAKDHAAPLELEVPNAATRAAIRESRELMKKRKARLSSAKRRIKALDQNGRKR